MNDATPQFNGADTTPKWEIKLGKEIKGNQNFVFWDWEQECVGKDLQEFITKLLKEEGDKIYKECAEDNAGIGM